MGLNDFKKCRKCGNIFRSMGNPLCSNCLNRIEDEFKLIKDFLYKNPNATVQEIANELNIDEKPILNFIKEGRLEMKVADGSVTCDKCGIPITSGRLCKACSGKLSNKLQSVLPQAPASKKHADNIQAGSKMHVEREK